MVRTSHHPHHHRPAINLMPQFSMVLFLLIILLLFVMALVFPTALT